MNRQIIVNLKWDEPEKPAGVLIVGSGDSVQVGQLLGQVRETCKARQVIGTEGLYRVIEEIFNDEGIPVAIFKVRSYQQMEVRM